MKVEDSFIASIRQDDKSENRESLFSIDNLPDIPRIGKQFVIGEWKSPMKDKTFVVGRNPGIAREAYYLSIKPDRTSDKTNTGLNVPYDFSQIHFVIRDIDEEITQITNVGCARKLVEIYDFKKDESYRLFI